MDGSANVSVYVWKPMTQYMSKLLSINSLMQRSVMNAAMSWFMNGWIEEVCPRSAPSAQGCHIPEVVINALVDALVNSFVHQLIKAPSYELTEN